MSKEEARTLSLIISSTRKQEIVKTISACTERTYLILKNYSSRETVFFKDSDLISF
jgi:hypothetical protein